MNFELLERVRLIFNKKNWEISSGITTSKFNLVCELLSKLDNQQEKELILELLEDFTHISFALYSSMIINTINEFLNKNLDIKLIYVLPLIKEEDIGKSKSCYIVHYQFKGTTIKYNIPRILKKEVNIYATDDSSKINKALSSNEMILLVDDFIGTGDTAVSAIDYLISINPFIEKSKILVYSIVIQKHGLDYLNGQNIKVLFSSLVVKGISENDRYSIIEKAPKLKIMSGIENKIKGLNKDFYLGYKQSEALVCMERAPNNTFPIFWRKFNKKTFPPFPR